MLVCLVVFHPGKSMDWVILWGKPSQIHISELQLFHSPLCFWRSLFRLLQKLFLLVWEWVGLLPCWAVKFLKARAPSILFLCWVSTRQNSVLFSFTACLLIYLFISSNQFLLRYNWHITLRRFKVTKCRLETFIYCCMVTMVLTTFISPIIFLFLVRTIKI